MNLIVFFFFQPDMQPFGMVLFCLIHHLSFILLNLSSVFTPHDFGVNGRTKAGCVIQPYFWQIAQKRQSKAFCIIWNIHFDCLYSLIRLINTVFGSLLYVITVCLWG